MRAKAFPEGLLMLGHLIYPHLSPMFPEEILHAIVAALVSRPVISEDLLQFHWRYVRGKLLSLALASKQLRRICMPFLFAYIEVKGAHGDLEKLGEQCAANPSFAACIRTFDLYCYAPEQVDAIHYFLHRCQNISQIILNKVQLDESLLHILRRHSAARIALASYSLPTCKEVGWLTMKRLNIGIDHTSIRDEKSELELAKHLECGIQLRSLTIHPNLLHKSFSTCVFGGLCELELWLSSIPFSLSWLAEFTAAHPLLRKIRISTPSVWDTAIMARDIPLIFSFLGEARREGLADEMKLQLKGFSVTRRTSPEATAALASSSSLTHSAESLAGWQVTGLWLSFTEKFSSRLLQLVHSSFPQIRIMSIENPLPSHGVKFIASFSSSSRPFYPVVVTDHPPPGNGRVDKLPLLFYFPGDPQFALRLWQHQLPR
ncbi:hypothetical protein D9757_009441 [Collybiopsis confluens]|uniref:Uncharacterized protein n=1 Tax=Collybiopsis confluens TaxID=2823264 RepID=A0A8H5M560_9AGAR|nr:hypothetical protein D9757_009441 [Collybiopsis confluens]